MAIGKIFTLEQGPILTMRRANRRDGWVIWRTPYMATLVFGLVAAQCQGQSGNEARPSYFEFGTVVELASRTLEVQAFDARTQQIVQHSFMRTRETHMDSVKVGDQVEVIFTANGGEWTARRLVALPAGIPSAGPAPIGPPVVAVNKSPANGKGRASLPLPPVVRVAKAPAPVVLGIKSVPKVAAVTPVPLGTAAGYSTPAPVPVRRAVLHDEPTAACHQADREWAQEPLRIAVLDFRYPTEREEAHDLTLASGGSGMAVADLVYTRLSQLPQYAVDRGDRRRLDRSDIAGAARLGRELGADAVLEGTFFPVEDPPGTDGSEGKLRGYELHAGLVDSCTGQVLLKMASESCPAGESVDAGAKRCTSWLVTAKDAEDPQRHASAFRGAIAAMLDPLEHNGGTVGAMGPAGEVLLNQNGTLTVRLADGLSVRPGEQLAVHASRLTKNPATYTLEDLHDQEIGRFTVLDVKGVTATGTFAGDIPPSAGDGLETVRE